jgi:4-nitrophenyl phosphatase
MDIRGAVIDLDGTVYRGGRLLDGAREGVAALRERGIDCLFVTNNPTRSPEAYAERLGSLGLDVDPEQVCSAGSLTATYLAEHHADDDVFLVGSPGLREMVADAGVRCTADPDAADVLVTSHSYDFDYDDLTAGLWALEDAAAFIGTDPDLTYPGEDGRDRPGSGAITSAVGTVAGRDPDHVLGKPSPETLEIVRERLGHPLDRCLVVGDRPDTDVALGKRGGMRTALVLSGTTRRADVDLDGDTPRLVDPAAPDLHPDAVVDGLGSIEAVVDGVV